MAGLFGNRQPLDGAYSAAGMKEPSTGAKLLNLVGMMTLGQDFLGNERHKQLAVAQDGFMKNLADATQGSPGLPALPPMQNPTGIDGKPLLGPQDAAGMGGVAPQAPLTINSPQMASIAIQAQRMGVPITQFLDVLKAQQPDVKYDRGFGYNAKTGDAAGAFHPDIKEGQQPLYDSRGNVVAVRNMDGSVQAAAEMAGAVEGAKAAATAPYTFPSGITDPSGRPIAASAAYLAGREAGGGRPITGMTPGERVTQEGMAKTGVDRATAQPQAYAGLQDQARTSDLVINSINAIVGDALDARSGKYVNSSPSKLNGWTTSFGANLAGVKGTPAHDLAALLDTIKSNVGFETLAKMRATSPTGGALGAVSERENTLLQSVLGALDQGQSPEQFASNLRQIRDQLSTIRGQRKSLYDSTYGGASAGPAPARPRANLSSVPMDARMAEARRRGLIK